MKNFSNFLMLQNMPTSDTLSNLSSSVAPTIGKPSLPISETKPDWIGKTGLTLELQNIVPMDGLVFSNAGLHSGTPQPLSTPPAFRSPSLANTSSPSEISDNEILSLLEKQRSQLEEQRSRLECIIKNCYFEPGILTEADEYFAELWNKQGQNSLEILSRIVNTHLNDEHMLEGVLHILSPLPYTEINPIGITIGIACGFNRSPLVVDRLIACFEDWENPDAIVILESMDLSSTPWLSHYRDRVVSMLKQKI